MAISVSAEIVSELIGCIYACATSPEAWPAALRRTNDVAACQASVVGIVSFEEDFSLVNATAGFDDGFALRYATNLPGLASIWGGDRQIAARPMHEPVVLSRHHPEALVRNTKQHDLLCEVLGFEVEDTLNLPLAHMGRAVGAAGWARKAGEGQFESELYRLFRLLSPHIQRSAHINRLLDAQALSLALRDDLLDRLRSPVMIVDYRMRLVQANEAAQSLPLGTLGKVLSDAVTDVTSGSTPYRCASLPLARDMERQIVHIMPLDVSTQADASYAALVFAPGRPVDDSALTALAKMRGLTDAETTVLSHLALGRSSASIARALNLKPSTVRTHVLRIFDKFEVHHRAELVAQLSAIVSPFDLGIHQTVDAELE